MSNKNRNKSNKATTTPQNATVGATTGYNRVVTLPKKRTEVETEYKPTVILTDNFIKEVNYLHKNVKQNTEWSAILLYSNKEGSIDNAKDWVISVDGCILMDIGTSTYTEYDMEAGDDYATEKWMDHLESGGKIGHLHTHHNMSCYFSGVDTQELHDNAPNHNYYLSLIVNYRDINSWCAKIAICGKEKTTGTMETVKSWIGSKGPMTKTDTETLEDTKEMLYLMKCKLTPESDTHVPAGLQSRLTSIIAKKAEKAKIITTTPGTGWFPGAAWDIEARDWIKKGTEKSSLSKDKKIVSMGNGTTKTVTTQPNGARVSTPYSASGEEAEEQDWTGLWDANGDRIMPVEVSSSEKTTTGTVIKRFAPEVCEPILAKVLAQDLHYEDTIMTCLMTMDGATEAAMNPYIDECAATFKEIVQNFFKEELTTLHWHAVAVSMYHVLAPYDIFTAYDYVDYMLEEYLMIDGDFSPNVIKQMTGIEIDEQMCLERPEEDLEVTVKQ